MSAAAAAMLEGMPAPRDLRLHQAGGRRVIAVGATVLFDYDAADTLMRNMVISALRQLGFPGRRVAAVLGLTESYVATLHNLALREGSAGRTPRSPAGWARGRSVPPRSQHRSRIWSWTWSQSRDRSRGQLAGRIRVPGPKQGRAQSRGRGTGFMAAPAPARAWPPACRAPRARSRPGCGRRAPGRSRARGWRGGGGRPGGGW